jgi:hypothetical protein
VKSEGESADAQYSERACRVVEDGPAALERDNKDMMIVGSGRW